MTGPDNFLPPPIGPPPTSSHRNTARGIEALVQILRQASTHRRHFCSPTASGQNKTIQLSLYTNEATRWTSEEPLLDPP
jgi:hypothetical protein